MRSPRPMSTTAPGSFFSAIACVTSGSIASSLFRSAGAWVCAVNTGEESAMSIARVTCFMPELYVFKTRCAADREVSWRGIRVNNAREWPRTGARSGAEASPVTSACRRASEWAVRGQDPHASGMRRTALLECRNRAHPTVGRLQEKRLPGLADAVHLRHLPRVRGLPAGHEVDERLAVNAGRVGGCRRTGPEDVDDVAD